MWPMVQAGKGLSEMILGGSLISFMKNLISILLENEPGALSRVVALFSARGYNVSR